MRGEKPLAGRPKMGIEGSPPRARGEGSARHSPQARFGITPACAGRSSALQLYGQIVQDHPRVRGEKRTLSRCPLMSMGSPPRARGEG